MESSPRPGGPVTYAIGDLHGEVTLLGKLLALLPFGEADTLVFLGDYMDRGEDSVALIRALRTLARDHLRCVFLRGNHDDAWLAEWDGARFARAPEMPGADEIWDRCEGRIPFEVGFFLEETRIEHEDEHAYYVHAGARPGEPIRRASGLIKMWGAPDFPASSYDWGKPVVFGHWQLDEPLMQPHKIGIDTGAYRTGVLTAVRLPDRALFQARR